MVEDGAARAVKKKYTSIRSFRFAALLVIEAGKTQSTVGQKFCAWISYRLAVCDGGGDCATVIQGRLGFYLYTNHDLHLFGICGARCSDLLDF